MMSWKVLLCDDEVHILRAAEIKLTRSGFEVQCAFDGQEAWEIVERWRPDALVTDLQMPRVDGLELARRVRGNPATSGLPIVLLTAKGFEAPFAEAARELGIAAVIPKPFSTKELIRLLENLLESAGGAAAQAGATSDTPTPQPVLPTH